MLTRQTFEFKPFSQKQKRVLGWWMTTSPVCSCDGIIADGSIRAGKTLSMSLSFIFWAMECYDGQNFAMCGKTIGSFRRNVLLRLKVTLVSRGYQCEDKRSDNLFIVHRKDKTNYFYIFGGKDERSQDLIQGITLAGAYFDEVALMPESFVNQATGRCSVEDSKIWFNCNPDGEYHWFNQEWLKKRNEKNLFWLHFTMDDNLSLSKKTKQKYKTRYSGMFYRRYILGEWCLAEGAIYGNFNSNMIVNTLPQMNAYWVGVDYGHSNATVFLLIGAGADGKLYICSEYYHSGSKKHETVSPRFYADAFVSWAKNALGDDVNKLRHVFIDPSASGFKAQLRESGITNTRSANNAVIEGIGLVSSTMDAALLYIHSSCKNTIAELPNYTWDEKAQMRGEDKPVKVNDHCVDALRYLIMGIKPYIKRIIANKF